MLQLHRSFFFFLATQQACVCQSHRQLLLHCLEAREIKVRMDERERCRWRRMCHSAGQSWLLSDSLRNFSPQI